MNDRAIQITSKNAPTVARTIHVPLGETMSRIGKMVVTSDEGIPWQIIDVNAFANEYEFVEPESKTEFRRVQHVGEDEEDDWEGDD